MKGRLSGGVNFRARARLRSAIAITVVLLFSGVCRGQQAGEAAFPAQQATALLEPFSSPEIDALAAKLMEKISAAKVRSVVVVGGANAENKVSELGVRLRDALNETMARQAVGVRVISSADVSEMLRRNRVSAGMIYCNLLSDWIAAYSQADVAVVLRIDRVENGRAVAAAQVFDERYEKIYDKKTNDPVALAEFKSEIKLTEPEADHFNAEYRAPFKTPAPKTGTNGLTMVKCLHCPYTKPYPVDARRLRVQGTVYLSVTVLPDGTADDISIDRPVGHGLDGASINTILGWKFAPSVDGQGLPVATRVPIENAFQLYSGSSGVHKEEL